ncbi:hypothetical protein EYF80_024019 [Liparis tanakae]|uniref:Uncharacterized protein n=1 Tax=Liparis tanakae TaxID=230148 RepID=A0A4Z2HIU0_9TELE|nr:hypothetical protein EYF80_024019 [Liparis tanakae]
MGFTLRSEEGQGLCRPAGATLGYLICFINALTRPSAPTFPQASLVSVRPVLGLSHLQLYLLDRVGVTLENSVEAGAMFRERIASRPRSKTSLRCSGETPNGPVKAPQQGASQEGKMETISNVQMEDGSSLGKQICGFVFCGATLQLDGGPTEARPVLTAIRAPPGSSVPRLPSARPGWQAGGRGGPLLHRVGRESRVGSNPIDGY